MTAIGRWSTFLTAVLTDGLLAVEVACTEAIAHGVHSADVVLNILARQRDPGPPATIFDLMGELKLYGMKAAYDEIMATAFGMTKSDHIRSNFATISEASDSLRRRITHPGCIGVAVSRAS